MIIQMIHSIDQSINQSIIHSFIHSFIHSIIQSINHSFIHSITLHLVSFNSEDREFLYSVYGKAGWTTLVPADYDEWPTTLQDCDSFQDKYSSIVVSKEYSTCYITEMWEDYLHLHSFFHHYHYHHHSFIVDDIVFFFLSDILMVISFLIQLLRCPAPVNLPG